MPVQLHTIQPQSEKLIRDLLGKPVRLTKGAAYEPGFSKPATIAVYADADGKRVGALVCSVATAAYLGAALTLTPTDVAQAAARTGTLDPMLLENFHEVANVCSQIFAAGASTRVTLSSVVAKAMTNPADLKPLLEKPTFRVDYTLDVPGYGNGPLSLRFSD